MSRPAAIVVHSGGPTSVLNASLVGVLDATREAGIAPVYGARFGAAGLVSGDWVDLSALSAQQLAAIRTAAGSVLGSSRRNIEPSDAVALMGLLRRRGVGWVFYTGGNGSMRTALLLEQTARDAYPELRVIGIPKTIDNDVAGTDHTPGFGSAARFFAYALRDIGADYRALPPPVGIVEVIGRNTGWVVGATALARGAPGDPPHLIYLPERPPSIEQICSDITRVHRQAGCVVVAVCEGLRDPAGQPFGADVDRPGSRSHELASNLAHTLARLVTQRTGLRARSEKPGLVGRSFALTVSETDAAESYLCGREAVRAAGSGAGGVMVALRRAGGEPYRVEPFLLPLEAVAGAERPLPADFIHPDGNDVTAEFVRWLRPLVGEIGPPARLL